ncbi:sulfurtransferase complex subunit TusD [uncultured Paraglaciecola sp.]|uniref:sulfurtransferase complex subunit TusD n=1 Tax=uncultured Paraglaciecola sp. TaxID=1765024 RepID=UPI002604391E|nr:sulfurtransferase complex subunit TusD [uncultured Paraglaciecola sp.]
MSSFTLLVTSAPYSSQSAYSAYRFALAAVASSHQVNGVFFYQDGTLNGNALQQLSSDEYDLHEAWKKVSAEHNIPLMVCVSAATKRGITNAQDAEEADQLHHSLSTEFQSVGLGDLAILLSESDRMVQF